MKKIKGFENYETKQFTEEDMMSALGMMTGWLLECFDAGELNQEPHEKALEILREFQSQSTTVSVPRKNPWKGLSITKNFPTDWDSTLTLRRRG